MRIPVSILRGCCICVSFLGFGQQPAPLQPGTSANNHSEGESKRILGIIPNYRTSPSLTPYVPIAPREKFRIGTQDSFDRGTIILAAVFAGEAQLTNSNRAFGQGAAGYGRYFGTSMADFVIGNYMTEAIYPTILHQDPRYFRRGTGSAWSRLGYAMSQIFVTHADSGRMQFNYSEFIGNSTAVAISQSYYQNNRTAGDALTKLGTQIGLDMGANILKEFSSDINHKFFHKGEDRRPPTP